MATTIRNQREGWHRRGSRQGLKLWLKLDGALPKFQQSAPLPPETPRMIYLSAPSSYPWSFFVLCSARMPIAVFFVARCKPCANSHDQIGKLKYLPEGLAPHVHGDDSKKSPLVPRQSRRRFDPPSVTGHQLVP